MHKTGVRNLLHISKTMVQVQVIEGLLEGELVQNKYRGSFFSFKGIPYAEPPIGNLRFKAPVPKKPWSGVYSAKKFGSICYQAGLSKSSAPRGSEDCLYLNVYTPDLKPQKPLPVMFWIHGGAFVSGSGNDDLFGPEFLVKHDVILVTINYRLEVLGFLCLDTPDVPGNAGLKDQVQALRWVNKNISSFGGDPKNITIFGHSAGAACVSYHLVSPMTKGLFKRAIVQSGAATCWWAKVLDPLERAHALARKLGFNAHTNKLYDFFKTQPVESLVNVKVPLTFSESIRVGVDIHFSIVNEKQFDDNETFFCGDILDLLPDAIHEGVEVIAGYTADEGVIIYAFGDFDKMYEQACKFPIYFAPTHITWNCTAEEQLKVGKKIKQFYMENPSDKNLNWERLARYQSLEVFVFDMIHWAKICAGKRTIYFYLFSSKSERNITTAQYKIDPLFGNKQTSEKCVTCHGEELYYLFNSKLKLHKELDMNSETYKMIENTSTLWTNFAKYGNPTPDDTLGVKWRPYSLENEDYLDIGNTLKSKSRPDYEEVQFWEDIMRQYAPQCLHKTIIPSFIK